jgi:hypothetical protein
MTDTISLRDRWITGLDGALSAGRLLRSFSVPGPWSFSASAAGLIALYLGLLAFVLVIAFFRIPFPFRRNSINIFRFLPTTATSLFGFLMRPGPPDPCTRSRACRTR